MFLGEDTHSVDDKGRVVLPARFRKQLVDDCVVTKGRDGQLMVFPPDVWERQASEVMSQPQTRTGRRFARTFFAAADQQTLDKAGRLLIKPDLREYSEVALGDDVVVIGVFDHIEIWNPGKYEQERLVGDEQFMWDEEDEEEDDD